MEIPAQTCSVCGTEFVVDLYECPSCHTPVPTSWQTTGLPPAEPPVEITNLPTMAIAPDGSGARVAPAIGSGPPVARASNELGTLGRGQQFSARYHIISLLGIGGMGEVYRAWDAELGLGVALKIIRPEVTSDPASAARLEKQFKNELVLARQVTHKHVVRIHDLGEINGIKYITMPYVEGSDLGTVLRREGSLGIARSLKLARQIVAGLEAAHEAGVVHRDLKPANIMVSATGEAVIMDFGIARSASGPAASGAVVGTLEYMAPEQASAGVVDHRADIYAVGLILYEMLAGRRRSSGSGSALDDMKARVESGVPPLRSVKPDIPETVAAIVAKCLQQNPSNRYQSSTELAADLNRLDDDGALIPELRRLTSRLMVAALIVGVGIAAGTYIVGHRAAPAAPRQYEPMPALVADFDNRTGDPAFEGSVEQTLALALEGAPYITVFKTKDARAIAAELSPAKATRITLEMGQLIARREGLKVLVGGAIDKQGTGYRVELRAVDPVNGKPITTTSQNVRDKAQVLNTVASMARKSVALAEAYLALGQRKLAADAAIEASKLGRAESTLIPAARVLLRAGQQEKALQIAADLEKLLQRGSTSYARLIAGEVALENGRFQQAIEAFRDAQKRFDSWFGRFLLGKAYVAAGGHFPEALAELELAVKRAGETTDVFIDDMPTLRYLPPAYYWLARAQEGSGVIAPARQNYERFLELRIEADPRDPLATDASRRLRDLR